MDDFNNCSTDIKNILFNVPLNSTDTYDLSTNTYNNCYSLKYSLKLNDNNEDSTNCLGNSNNIFSLYGEENSTSPYSIYKNMDELKFLYENEKNPDNLKDVFDEFIQYDTEDNTSQESECTSKKLVSKNNKVKKSKTVKKSKK